MDTKGQFRSSRIPAHLDATTAGCLRAPAGNRATSLPHTATPTSPHLDPSVYYCNRQFSNELMQYHTSMTNVQKIRQTNATATRFNGTSDCAGLPLESYRSKSMVCRSTYSEAELNWTRALQETALRNNMLSPKASPAMNQTVQQRQWPNNLTPMIEDQRVMQYHRPSSYNQEVPSSLNYLQMQGRPEVHPFAHRFTMPSMERTPPLDPSPGGRRESAFSRPAPHLESPAAYSSLDMEIRRLQGMITRVEMLREKYKCQEGALQYPRAHPKKHTQEVHGRPFSKAQPNSLMAMYSQRQIQVAQADHRSSYSSGYSLQQDVSQIFTQKSAADVDVSNQGATMRAGCSTAPVREYPRVKLPGNPKDGMPRIVEVRSLAQGAGQEAIHPDKPLRHPEISQPKVPSTKHSVKLPAESSRNETGSVESLDSGVECMSSPTDVQSQRSLASGYGRYKQLEDLHVKEEAIGRADFHQSLPGHPLANPMRLGTPTGTLHYERSPDPALSLLATKSNRKRPISTATVETMIKKSKSRSDNAADETKMPGFRSGDTPSVPREGNDRALDLSLKKGYTHHRKSPKKTMRNLQQQSRTDDGAMKLSMRCKAGAMVRSRSYPADDCPSKILHHHGKSVSLDDLVALSIQQANEVPRRKKESHLEEFRQRREQETRGRFISNLIQKAEDMLLDRLSSVSSNRGTGTPEPLAPSDTRETKSISPKPSLGDVREDKTKPSTTIPPEAHSSQTDSAEQNLTSRIPVAKNPLYIDAMVNEAMRVLLPPPSEEELERQDMSLSFDSLNGMENPVCHSPGQLIISQDETDSDSYKSGAASPPREPSKPGVKGSTVFVSESSGSKLCHYTENPPSSKTSTAQPSVTSKPQTVQISKAQLTQNSDIQQAEHSKPQPTQNSVTIPQAPGSPSRKIKLRDVQVMVRPLQPIAPKPVPKVSPPIRLLTLPEVQVENSADSQNNQQESTCCAPNFVIPTEEGFRRMQKLDTRVCEIYRVVAQPLEPVQTKNPRKQIQNISYSVYYREMSFPCVLRSNVPFVPTQLLTQDLFPSIEASRVSKAMQLCSILNRYMIRHEQEALQEPLRRRGITSCKLLPLDELHDKWDEILHYIPRVETPADQN